MLELLLVGMGVDEATGNAATLKLALSGIGAVTVVAVLSIAFASSNYDWRQWDSDQGLPYADSVLAWVAVTVCCPSVAVVAFLLDRRHAKRLEIT